FLVFRDTPTQSVAYQAQSNIAGSLTQLKRVLAQPTLWRTKKRSSAGVGALESPTGSGHFTPRHAGQQVALVGGGADATATQGGLGVSLFSRPLTLSGLAPIALETSQEEATQTYNLGVNLGISRFQVGAAVSRIAGDRYAFDATGLDVDVRYLGESWQTNIALSGVTGSEATARLASRGFVHDQSFAVEWGASYLLTPALSLGGSLRFSGFKDTNSFGLDDSIITDSAVFLGTNLKF
ncbi:MAG: hypothetical protein AAF607_16095, partial [Pseudomonadota bacterium]